MTTSRGAGAPSEVVVVTAVKALGSAKSRFAASGDGLREAIPGLVLAMLRDVLAAALAAPEVTAVYVVSPDPAVRAAATDAGGRPVPEPEPGGLNAALRAGADAARRGSGPGVAVLALQPDLPALTVDELRAFLAATEGRRAFVPDHTGTGTAALFSPAGTELRPEFGPDSAAAHAAGGAVGLAGPWPGLRTDVDTPSDLASATGVGRHTASALSATDTDITSNSRTLCARMDR